MNNIKELIIESVESTYENMIKNDEDYIKLEETRFRLLGELKLTLEKEEYKKVEELMDCLDGQNYITAMGFSFVRAIDLNKVIN